MNISASHDIAGLRLLGHSDLGGPGDGMQIMVKGDHIYVGRPSPGTPFLILDVSDPGTPRIVGAIGPHPGTWMPKCQLHGDLLLVNYEQRRERDPAGRTGFGVFDISDPAAPRELCYVDTGGNGVHRMWWAGERHAYLSTRPEGFGGRMLQVYDMQAPERPELVGQWWTPGLWTAGGEVPKARANGPQPQLHHGIYHEGRLYCGHGAAGLLVMDVTDPTRPQVLTELEWEPGQGGATHTALPLPGRGLLAVVDEAQSYRPPDLFPPGNREYRAGSAQSKPENPKYLRIIDNSDETAPRVVSRWRPDPDVFAQRTGRYGPHNLHENRPGTFRSETLLFGTFFNAGLHVLDITDAESPRSIAHFIPPPGGKGVWTNDLVVGEDGRIYITDRADGGVHILEMS